MSKIIDEIMWPRHSGAPSGRLSHGELVRLVAEALHERAAYLIEHADTVKVRVQIGEKFEDYPLSELRGAMAMREAFRLPLRAEVPHRVLNQEGGEPWPSF